MPGAFSSPAPDPAKRATYVFAATARTWSCSVASVGRALSPLSDSSTSAAKVRVVVDAKARRELGYVGTMTREAGLAEMRAQTDGP